MLRRLVLLAAVAGVLTALYTLGFFELLGDPQQARAAIEELGGWAPVLYVLAFALLEPFFVPGIAFIIPGSVVWPLAELFVLSWLGSIGAGIVGFSFARYLGRDYVKDRLPARLHRYDQRLAERGLRTVIIVRLTLFLAPPAHWLLGLSKVRFGAFVLGTALGFLPGIALLTFLVATVGQSLGEYLANRPPGYWIGAAVVGVVGFIAIRRLRKRRRRQSPATTDPRGE